MNATLAAAVMGLNACMGVPADVIALFSPHSYKWSANDEVYHYRLYEPSEVGDGTRKYPLVVWLHGYGERGDDNIAQLEWLDKLILTAPRRRERFPFFLLAVQCPHRRDVWFDRAKRHDEIRDDMLELTHALIQKLVSERSIDPDRVCLAGLSTGGTACWELALRYPDTFAAMVPTASSGMYSFEFERLAGMSIWAFHSRDDGGTPVKHVRQSVQGVLEAGGNVRLTEIASGDHDCWSAAFRDYHAFDWLLGQRRGEGRRAGRLPLHWRLGYALENWNWWQLLAQFIVVVLPTGLCVNLWRLYKRGAAAQR